MNAIPASELQQCLRAATKQPHHLLDHHPLLAPVVREDLSVDQYGDALAGLHGVFAQAEAGIMAFLERQRGLFDYAPRRKLPALEADLAALGRAPIEARIHLPQPRDIAEFIGVLYTVEGTTQGGQVIARNLRQSPQSGLPMRFFSGYGDLSQRRWREFLDFAAAACPPAGYAAAAAAAAALFAAIKEHLDDAGSRLPGPYPRSA